MAYLKIEIELTRDHEVNAEIKMDTAGDELFLEQFDLTALSPDQNGQRLMINLKTNPGQSRFSSWIHSIFKKDDKRSS